MTARFLFASLLAGLSFSTAAQASCRAGIYGASADAFVVLGKVDPAPSGEQRFLFRDGRRGAVNKPGEPISCADDVVTYQPDGSAPQQWLRQATVETNARFESAATDLAGQLIEPVGPPDPKRPLVVMVHGSETRAAIGGVYPYMLAAQGIAVFVYDKRGTGASEGDYTQNFELLADDAAAALAQARRMAAGRFGRAGYFGGSQGGWVAPLAATRSAADFVAVGFGLVVSPIEEDRSQLIDEAQAMRLTPADLAKIEGLSRATAHLVRSHFTTGFEEMARVRREIGSAPWASTIKGEYSGDMLRMTDSDLRRIGRARFDNLELIWDYDAAAALRRLRVPLLWVLAGEDREAPIERTRATLASLAAAGQPINVYLFPETDHGMVEFHTNPDGSRTTTRITDGYLRLLADWIKMRLEGPYGRAEKIR
jgi:pimeloyl-ACP methyl ester carboxylesterase